MTKCSMRGRGRGGPSKMEDFEGRGGGLPSWIRACVLPMALWTRNSFVLDMAHMLFGCLNISMLLFSTSAIAQCLVMPV
ncbi:unnamed protein product [Ixodes pacificus]